MKTEAAASLESVQVSLDYGVVREKLELGFEVEVRGRRIRVERAAGCLIEPEPGDLALMSVDSFGRSFLLSVLTRANKSATSLGFEGDVSLTVKNGRLTTVAGDGLDLVSGGELNLFTPSLNVGAAEAEVSISSFKFVGALLESSIDKIKLVGRTCDSIFERVSQRAENCYRWVTGLENVKAGSLTYSAEKLLSMRGKYSAVTAEKDVRIDGDKILMG